METSKRFTVVDTRTNTVKTFNSTATTVGELKADLRNLGIDPTDMDIQEGLTKTELGGDDSLLPSDITYRGVVTNNLVFRLTQQNKKIKSGNCNRHEIYNKIKELSLTDIIKEKYGDNYTRVKTEDLVREVENAMQDLKKAECHAYVNASDNCVRDCLATLTSILVKADIITPSEGNSVVRPILNTDLFDEEVYSDHEIEDMFAHM